MRWFKFDNNLVNDPLVQRLSGDKFKALVNMWCLVSSNGGVLPLATDLTFLMRPLTEEKITALIEEFVEKGLLDAIDGDPVRYVPRNWDARQAVDVTAAERSKRYRDAKRGVTRDGRDGSSDASRLDKKKIREKDTGVTVPTVTHTIEVRDDRALAAWDEYGRRVNGAPYPRTRRGGWDFPTKWPPGFDPETGLWQANVRLIKGGS